MTDEMRDEERRTQERKAYYQRYRRAARWRSRMRKRVKAFSWVLTVGLVSASKRAVDFCVSLTLLLVLSPIMALGYLLSAASLQTTPRFGQWGKVFDELSFTIRKGPAGSILKWLGVRRLPVLVNILKGDMSFVGPLPASPGDLNPAERAVRKRHNVRPGLISLWWIRRRANIDYGTELEADAEYVENHGVWSDIGISLRAIPAILYGEGVPTAPDQLTLLGIRINNLTMAEALDTILQWAEAGEAKQVCFVNADCANIAYKDQAYLQVLREANLCLADGIGLKLAAKLLGQDIKQNVNGTDLFPQLCGALCGRNLGVFLLGAREHAAQGVADWIRTHFPEVQLCGWQHGYFPPEQEQEVIQRIKNSGAHLLLVAFGSPTQDLWIHEHLKDTGVKVAMGVGGLFDFYSGRISRAPLWMREIGMEWVYRLIQEPGRLWKRYLIGNGMFLWRVLRERFLGRTP